MVRTAFYRAIGNGRCAATAFDPAVVTLAELADGQRPELRCRAGINPDQLHRVDTIPLQQSLPRPELGAGDPASLLRSPTLRAGMIIAAIALALFAGGAAAARFWSHETERQTAPPSPPPTARPHLDDSRPAAEPASPGAPVAGASVVGANEMPDGAPRGALGQLPGSKQNRVLTSRALPGRAPEPSTDAGPPRQQLTAPTTDALRHAPTIATVAGRGGPADELTRDQVRRGVRDAVDRLRGCYEDQLLFTPALAGTIRAQFSIGADGRVASATATGLGDAVDFCVVAVIRSLVFPGSDSRVRVNYPLYFHLVRRPHGHRGVAPELEVGAPAVGRLPG